MTEDQRQKVALFRFGVIGPLISGELFHGERKKKIWELSRRHYAIPYSRRTCIGFGTIEEWLSNYRRKGFEGLLPSVRSDRGNIRALSEAQRNELVNLKIEHPKMSAQTIIESLVARNKLRPNEIAPASVYRLFQQQIPRRMANKTGKEQKRFVHRYPNDCWQADTMHGPYIKDNDTGKARKTYLIAFIDDASRLITGAEFFYTETTAHIKSVLRQAVMTYGVPTKLYVDNGLPYRSTDISIACASMNTALIHTTPYYPQAKGKIERFFRTVRSRFITGIKSVHSLHELNLTFDAWVQDQYNRHEHGGLDKQKPLTVFLHNVEGRLRRLPKHIDPAELFCRKQQRTVALDGTFRINNRLYETEEHLIGKKIFVLYDVDDPTHRVKVFDGPCYVHSATPLDYLGNAQAKRKPLN